MLTITGSLLSILDKLEPERVTVNKAKVFKEHSAIKRKVSPKTRMLTIGAACLAFYRSFISIERISY
jgi:hypothetical protein